jgi:hypothetical protein
MRSELELTASCSTYFRSSARADSSSANTYYSEAYTSGRTVSSLIADVTTAEQ